MASPPWRPIQKFFRRLRIRLTHDPPFLPIVACSACLLFLIFFFLHSFRSVVNAANVSRTSRDASPSVLFIAIGSAPNNTRLRETVRQTWLQWIPEDGSVEYRFFTDAPPSIKHTSNTPPAVWRALRDEVATYQDLVLQPLPTGYGTREHNAYGQRALYQLHWANRNAPAHFFLRVDDDAFLCLHRLLYELRTAPRQQFFWGRFWCREGRNRADESFMLFSSDVVHLLADDTLVAKILPFDRQVTLGWNFGYWSWVLNMTIFDDQKRIDSQQGYLTKYMHTNDEPVGKFCETLLYAHHVTSEAMLAAYRKSATHVMYDMPVRTGPAQTCKEGEQSFVPGRHSSALPSLKITRADRSFETEQI